MLGSCAAESPRYAEMTTTRRQLIVMSWLLLVGGAGCARPRAREQPAHETSAVAEAPAPMGAAELVLRAVLPVDSAEENFQPSGLWLDDGELLTVSDKHDRAIYRLELREKVARALPFVVFEPPEDELAPLDFEGVTAAESGGWLLTSESSSRVLEVRLDPVATEAPGAAAPATGQARWRTASLWDAGQAAGCLVVPNAGLEGITLLPAGGLLLAAEREPRALLAFAASSAEPPRIELMESSEYPRAAAGRNLDFSDLTRSGEHVYALARNQHLLVRLTHTSGAWREAAAFSYGASENDPKYRYESRKFGVAEGVAIAEREVFVILDNNGLAREADPSDRRALLFVFERPAGL
jgi:hypothetical protein